MSNPSLVKAYGLWALGIIGFQGIHRFYIGYKLKGTILLFPPLLFFSSLYLNTEIRDYVWPVFFLIAIATTLFHIVDAIRLPKLVRECGDIDELPGAIMAHSMPDTIVHDDVSETGLKTYDSVNDEGGNDQTGKPHIEGASQKEIDRTEVVLDEYCSKKRVTVDQVECRNVELIFFKGKITVDASYESDFANIDENAYKLAKDRYFQESQTYNVAFQQYQIAMMHYNTAYNEFSQRLGQRSSGSNMPLGIPPKKPIEPTNPIEPQLSEFKSYNDKQSSQISMEQNLPEWTMVPSTESIMKLEKKILKKINSTLVKNIESNNGINVSLDLLRKKDLRKININFIVEAKKELKESDAKNLNVSLAGVSGFHGDVASRRFLICSIKDKKRSSVLYDLSSFCKFNI
jgi:hypothetical protein